jgi:hypothetical protein
MILFGIGVIWHWFCSCQSKCICDPEGGAFKHSADEYEALDSAIADKRKKLRNAWELVEFGREKLTKNQRRTSIQKEKRCLPPLYSAYSRQRARCRKTLPCSQSAREDLRVRLKRQSTDSWLSQCPPCNPAIFCVRIRPISPGRIPPGTQCAI